MEVNDTFETERLDDTVVLTPRINLGELEYLRISTDGRAALAALTDDGAKHVVVDFSKTDYCGSTALGFFVRLWKRSRMQGGHMAFCNVSPLEREILATTRLDTLWSICESRTEALDTVRERENQL